MEDERMDGNYALFLLMYFIFLKISQNELIYIQSRPF